MSDDLLMIYISVVLNEKQANDEGYIEKEKAKAKSVRFDPATKDQKEKKPCRYIYIL